MTTTAPDVSKAVETVQWVRSERLSLRDALEYLCAAGYAINARAATDAIGRLTYGQSRDYSAVDAYGGVGLTLTVGYTGNGNVGGRFFWTLDVAE